MNWTGGQLRRHSGHHGVLSKTQRQKFAKSRQLAGRPSRQPPLDGLADPGTHDNIGTEAQTLSVTFCRLLQLCIVMIGLPAARVFTNSGSLVGRRTAHPNGDPTLDSLRRQLLQDPDWGALSAARPLEMSFASAEEIARFGKRRRLNDTDRKRLAVQDHQPLPGRFQTCWPGRPDVSPQEDHLDGIKIEINGRPVGGHSHESEDMAKDNTSPRSIPPDHGDTTTLHVSDQRPAQLSTGSPWGKSPSRLSLRPSYSQLPSDMLTKPSPYRRAKNPESSGHQTSHASLDSCITTSPTHLGRELSARSLSHDTLPYPTDDFPEMGPRVATDDKIPADQTERGTIFGSSQKPDYAPSRGAEEVFVASPTVVLPHVMSDREPPSWLPKQRLPQSEFFGLNRPEATRNPELMKNEHQGSLSPFVEITTESACQEPIKVFGQLVRLQT